MSPHPAPPHEHLFRPEDAEAGRAAREADPPRSLLIGCGESGQLGVADTTPRAPWTGPPIPWPALQQGWQRPI